MLGHTSKAALESVSGGVKKIVKIMCSPQRRVSQCLYSPFPDVVSCMGVSAYALQTGGRFVCYPLLSLYFINNTGVIWRDSVSEQ